MSRPDSGDPAATGTAAPSPGPGYMRDTDAFSWYLERDPLLRATVVTVQVLDRPPVWETLRARVDRGTRRLPLFRSRVVVPPWRLAPPRWAEAGELDLDWHLQRVALPAPGGWEELLDLARQRSVKALDPARPLWEMTLVEGLPDGQAALVMCFHHSLTDGIGGVQLAGELFDLERFPGPDDRPAPLHQAEEVTGLRLVREGVGRDVDRLAQLLRTLPRTGVTSTLHVLRSPARAVRESLRTAGSIARYVAPVSDTRSPVMQDRTLARRFDVLEVPLVDLHRAARTAGGHLNDAFLAAVTGGLRRYHERLGAGVEELRLTLPISMRRPDDPPGGNRLALVRLALPVGLANPAERMTAIHDIVESWRHEPALALTQPVAAVLNLLPSGVVGSMLKHVDFLASDVPGFPVPIFLAGSQVVHYYAFGPTIGTAINVTLLSYAGTCGLGISCDTSAVPDLDLMVECLREGLEEVLDLGGPHGEVRRGGFAPHEERPARRAAWTS